MENKLRLIYPVVVEGRYDRLKLLNIIESPVITINGFAIFNNSEKKHLLSRISRDGIIILTDSDKAGNFIRARLRQYLNPDNTIHLYTPQLSGKEKRKSAPSKQGLLGVEGMDEELLYELLKPYSGNGGIKNAGIDRMRFWRDGLSGGKDSAEKRRKLCAALSLPVGLSSKALLEAVNLTCSAEEYERAVNALT